MVFSSSGTSPEVFNTRVAISCMDKIAEELEINRCIDDMVVAYVCADRSFREGWPDATAKYQQQASEERNRLYRLIGRVDMQFKTEE